MGRSCACAVSGRLDRGTTQPQGATVRPRAGYEKVLVEAPRWPDQTAIHSAVEVWAARRGYRQFVMSPPCGRLGTECSRLLALCKSLALTKVCVELFTACITPPRPSVFHLCSFTFVILAGSDPLVKHTRCEGYPSPLLSCSQVERSRPRLCQ